MPLSCQRGQANTSYVAITHPEDAGSLPESYLSQIKAHSEYLTNTYARPPLILSHGKGSWVFDAIGRKYLDFSAGIAVNALGHGDEEIAQLAGEQASKMIHTSNVWYNEWAGELAQLLVETTKQHGGLGFAPGGKEQRGEGGAKVFFSNSGTEANEGAIKFARKYGKEFWANEMTNGVGAARKWEDSTKTKVIHFTNAFHGRSLGALSATANPKYQLPFTPLIPGFELVQYGDIDGFRARIDEDTCAVLVEPIQGEGGVNEGTEEFFRTLRAECDRVGAVLIFDEIQVCSQRNRIELPIYSRLVWSLPHRLNVGTLQASARLSPRYHHHGETARKRVPHRCHHGPRPHRKQHHTWSVPSSPSYPTCHVLIR